MRIDPSVYRELRQFDRRKGRRKGAGYLSVHLRGNGHSSAKTVHSIVLAAFVGPRPLGSEARHLNGIRTDNHIANLQWSTHRENESDKEKHGTRLREEAHPRSILTRDDVLEIRKRLASGEGPTSIARSFGVTKTSIIHIKTGRNWRTVQGASHV